MHRKNLDPFVRWIGDRAIEEIEPHDMEMFLDWYEVHVQKRHGRSPSTTPQIAEDSSLAEL